MLCVSSSIITVSPIATVFSAEPGNIHAENCGISAGRDANGNTINCTINKEVSPAQLKELVGAINAGVTDSLLSRIELLSSRLGINNTATKILLKKIGQNPDIPEDELPEALTKIATTYKNIEAQKASIDPSDPVSRALVKQVQTELAAGRLETAGNLLKSITTRVVVLNGTCTMVKAAGLFADKQFCVPQIMNTEYVDKRVAFTFFIHNREAQKEAAIVTFSGYGPDQTHYSKDEVFQPVDKIVFTLAGSSDYLKSSGICTFSNPYKGIPAKVTCSARTTEGEFIGEFVSNGVAPDMFEAGVGMPARKAGLSDVRVIEGKCHPSSHIAEGRGAEDLRKRQARFFCDNAVIATYNDSNSHKLIQFSESQSHHSRILGFGGYMNDDRMMSVKNVYLEAGIPSVPVEGHCVFFYTNNNISGLTCGAMIDEQGRRTVPVVAFEASSKGLNSRK